MRLLAHEQYVLTQPELDKGFSDTTLNVLDSLKNPDNILIAIAVAVGILVVLSLYFVFQYSKTGLWLDRTLLKFENAGHFFIRISLAVSLLASGFYNSYLGPEIPVASINLQPFLVPALYILGMLLLLGLFTRITAFLGLAILIVATFYYGEYMLTYFNYFGEYIALVLTGSYYWSFDRKFFGTGKTVKRIKDWEILILRICYGVSILYPAITIKFLNPAVIVEIFNKYEMHKIWWLFPSDGLLTSLGTGIVQVVVGVLVIIGFQTRLASFVTFLLYLGSIVFFQEAVWPHIVLLALALYFVVNDGGKYTLNQLIYAKFFKNKKIKK